MTRRFCLSPNWRGGWRNFEGGLATKSSADMDVHDRDLKSLLKAEREARGRYEQLRGYPPDEQAKRSANIVQSFTSLCSPPIERAKKSPGCQTGASWGPREGYG
jgi:hypothetical protein